MGEQEQEVKFLLKNAPAFSQKMTALGAELVSPRTNEWNLRFDTPANELSTAGRALRLRKDDRVRLTYKGPSDVNSEVNSREELEVEVSDFATARKILKALGFQVVMIYEKFRTTWHLDGAEVVLDELPMGTFCEIEGHSPEQIRQIADALELKWDRRISTSYLSTFSLLRTALALPPVNLTFDEMAKITIPLQDFEKIRIYPAD
jgi:adenylate cyclase, class 2